MYLNKEFVHQIGKNDYRCTEIEINIFLFNKFCSENRSFNEIMWKNIVEPDRTQIIMYYGACALHTG